MDPNNPDLTGESTNIPAGSQPGTITSESITSVNPQGATTLSTEEAAWNELKGGTQDRIKTILRERDDALEEARRAQDARVVTPPAPTYSSNPDSRNAQQILSDVGMATKDEVKQLLNQELGKLSRDFELERLEARHSGSDGFPKFERDEYRDFVNRNPQYKSYDPEDVYEKMYKEEIRDAELKALRQPRPKQSTTNSLRPTATQEREEGLTPEFIEKRLQQPDGRKWYAENKDRINATLASFKPSAE